MGSLQDSKDRARPLLPRLSQHCLLSSPTAPPSGCLIILNYLSPLKNPNKPYHNHEVDYLYCCLPGFFSPPLTQNSLKRMGMPDLDSSVLEAGVQPHWHSTQPPSRTPSFLVCSSLFSEPSFCPSSEFLLPKKRPDTDTDTSNPHMLMMKQQHKLAMPRGRSIQLVPF